VYDVREQNGRKTNALQSVAAMTACYCEVFTIESGKTAVILFGFSVSDLNYINNFSFKSLNLAGIPSIQGW